MPRSFTFTELELGRPATSVAEAVAVRVSVRLRGSAASAVLTRCGRISVNLAIRPGESSWVPALMRTRADFAGFAFAFFAFFRHVDGARDAHRSRGAGADEDLGQSFPGDAGGGERDQRALGLHGRALRAFVLSLVAEAVAVGIGLDHYRDSELNPGLFGERLPGDDKIQLRK